MGRVTEYRVQPQDRGQFPCLDQLTRELEKTFSGIDLANLTVKISYAGIGGVWLTVKVGEAQGQELAPIEAAIDYQGRIVSVADNRLPKDPGSIHKPPPAPRDVYLSQSSLTDFVRNKFGPYHLPRTVITASQAGDLWPRLKAYDVWTDQRGPGGDDIITHDDILEYAARSSKTAEVVAKEIEAVVSPKPAR